MKRVRIFCQLPTLKLRLEESRRKQQVEVESQDRCLVVGNAGGFQPIENTEQLPGWGLRAYLLSEELKLCIPSALGLPSYLERDRSSNINERCCTPSADCTIIGLGLMRTWFTRRFRRLFRESSKQAKSPSAATDRRKHHELLPRDGPSVRCCRLQNGVRH